MVHAFKNAGERSASTALLASFLWLVKLLKKLKVIGLPINREMWPFYGFRYGCGSSRLMADPLAVAYDRIY